MARVHLPAGDHQPREPWLPQESLNGHSHTCLSVCLSVFSVCSRSQPECTVARSASPAGAGSTERASKANLYHINPLRNVIKSTVQILSRSLGSLRYLCVIAVGQSEGKSMGTTTA